ncbi:MAG: alpha-amylase family glycosyl hydrolase [Clostridiales bacterium]|nr:alpha-amylase family glycosyl hydrolase [Clostridiales bacterium]
MPKWLENAIFYEVYPQSFNDTNGDGIGDINGITEKLDYIKELGCNALWLNPCFVSPFNDAGYDVADYYKVAPRYGTNEDLKALFDKAHEMDMHIILDLVPGHTSVEHPWFKESMKPEKNEYSGRYIWTDSVWKGGEGIQGVGGSLRGISDRDGSCLLNFFSSQPALNYGFANPTEKWMSDVNSPEVRSTVEEIKNIMRFWLGMGCDGFRVDMAGSLVKNDDCARATIKLWQEFRGFLDEEYPEAMIISEWGDPSLSLEGGFHADFLLHFGPSHYNDLFRCEHPYFSHEGEGDISEFTRAYMGYRASTGGKGMICIPSGNHDMARISHKLNEDELKLAFAFLLSMPGAPFIYYGDEIGMRYLDGITSVEGGYERTGSRSPMQWDESKNAGFSDGDKLYIRLDDSSDRPCASKQMQDENSLRSEVKRLIEIRNQNPALSNTADIEFIKYDGYPFIYRRFTDTDSVYVIINPHADKKRVSYIIEGEVIYSQGKAAYAENGGMVVPGGSVTYIKR